MAAPNLFNPTTCTAKTACSNVGSSTTIAENPDASGMVLKINTLVLANSGADDTSATVVIFKNGTSNFYLAFEIVVPKNASLIVIGKAEDALYLEENDSLIVSSPGSMDATCSYEELS